MKKLLITLLLISPASFADWGDVYYCQMTTHSQTTLEGKETDYKLEKFTFKLDKAKNAMVFGSQGYFQDHEEVLREGLAWPSREIWYAEGTHSESFFKEGKFVYSYTGSSGIATISADCDKF